MSNTLCIHNGCELVTPEILDAVETPAATKTWQPLPHMEVVECIERTLLKQGFEIVTTELVMTSGKTGRPRGAWMFGLMALKSLYTDFQLTVGFRNSHDKSFPLAMTAGSRVFVCDNLAFSGEVRMSRRHKTHIQAQYPMMIADAISQLHGAADAQHARIGMYKTTELTTPAFHDFIINGMLRGIYPQSNISQIVKEWNEPRHPEFKDHTVWSAFNCVTETLKGSNVFTLPSRTTDLHFLADEFSLAAMN